MAAPTPNDDGNSPVHLGFCEPIENENTSVAHTSPNWSEWDGGQVGGRPSWLNPEHLPTRPISCLECQQDETLCFLCQLYAPADTVNPNAFHRTLYVFACPSCCSVRVLRTQLARENGYYPSDCSTQEDTKDWNQHLPETYEIKLCKVCGQRGKGVCPLQQESFCGTWHQKQHKQYVFEQDPPKPLPSVYPIHELVVEEESSTLNDHVEEERNIMFEAQDENDDDQDLEQDDLNAMTGARGVGDARKDPVTDEFFHRVERAKDQCVRYHQWHDESILWTSSENMPSSAAIPDCPYCGAPRRFEFQLMPQLLHYLKSSNNNTKSGISQQEKDALMAASTIVEKTNPDQVPAELKETHEKAIRSMQSKLLDSDKELDWGVVVVYTCTASCDGGGGDDDEGLGAYRQEFAFVQPSLS